MRVWVGRARLEAVSVRSRGTGMMIADCVRLPAKPNCGESAALPQRHVPEIEVRVKAWTGVGVRVRVRVRARARFRARALTLVALVEMERATPPVGKAQAFV